MIIAIIASFGSHRVTLFPSGVQTIGLVLQRVVLQVNGHKVQHVYIRIIQIAYVTEEELGYSFAISLPEQSVSCVLEGHNIEVMVYQYDRFFGYGCWMTSIPTMN